MLRKLYPVLIGFALALAASVMYVSGGSAAGSNGHIWPGPRTAAHSGQQPVTTRPSVSAASSCDGGFDAVTSPNGANNNYVFATAALSANDVWAVGITNFSNTAFERPLAEHWNGSSWSIVPIPSPTSVYWADLNGVAAISANDVWAAGDYQINASGYISAFAEHWNGTSWTIVTMTQPGFNFNFAFALTAISSTNVWAVGASNSAGWFNLAEHWDGASWTPSPILDKNSNNGGFANNQLFSVSALSANDVWAVGSWQDQTSQRLGSLAEHWNGSTWTIVTTPNEGGDNEIAAVSALEPGHAVGVGSGNFLSGVSARQGEVWNLVAGGGSTNSAEAGPGLGDNVLEGVDRSGAGLWAVGFWRAGATTTRESLVIPATWNSTTHTLTWGSPGTSANPSAFNNVLFAVSAISPYSFWAGGYQTNNSNLDQTLTETYCALKFSLAAPAAAVPNSPFSVTLTVQNGSAGTVSAYRGTVHFTSTDPSATLPADYTFQPSDVGSHTFTGVVLATPCYQAITAADVAMPLTVPASATVEIFRGACQSPLGSPGSRASTTGSSGTPVARGANPSGGAPGPRVARTDVGQLTAAAEPALPFSWIPNRRVRRLWW